MRKCRKLAVSLGLLFAVFLSVCLLSGCSGEQAETESGKITLTLARCKDSSLPAVKEFNLAQDRYVIEIVDYSNDGALSTEDARKKLNAELASGDGPDLIDLWSFDMDVEDYGPKGYLADLFPLMEDDADISKEDFQQSFLNAYCVDGALYGAVPAFSVITLLGDKEALDALGDWDYDTLSALADERGGADALFTSEATPDGFLSNALQTGHYWDLDTLTARFDTDEYRQLLEFCARFTEFGVEDEESENPIFSQKALYNFMEWQYYESLWGEVAVLGYPDGSGSASCFVNMMEQYGINAASKNIDGAWEFIKIILSADFQIEQYVTSGFNEFPTNLEALDALIEKSMQTLYEQDDNGNDTEVEMTARGFEEDFAYHAATQEQIDAVLALIDETTGIFRSDSPILEIAMEEAEDYFSGQKTVEEVMSLTQNRAMTYLDERG